MKKQIIQIIEEYVRAYQKRPDIETSWNVPLVGFADAKNPRFSMLKELVLPDHQTPEDILPDPAIVISYFIPFTEQVGDSNRSLDGGPSRQWSRAYYETNTMMAHLNSQLKERIEAMGYRAAASEVAGKYSQDVLKSRWSQRHVANIAGLGTFGINNMLITERGCCGRFQSVVTSLPVEPDQAAKEERCLYKKNGTCKVCVMRCKSGALTVEGFDRFLCNRTCREQDRYGEGTCGKCVVGLPCTYKMP